jgi:hypothetical protein
MLERGVRQERVEVAGEDMVDLTTPSFLPHEVRQGGMSIILTSDEGGRGEVVYRFEWRQLRHASAHEPFCPCCPAPILQELPFVLHPFPHVPRLTSCLLTAVASSTPPA